MVIAAAKGAWECEGCKKNVKVVNDAHDSGDDEILVVVGAVSSSTPVACGSLWSH